MKRLKLPQIVLLLCTLLCSCNQPSHERCNENNNDFNYTYQYDTTQCESPDLQYKLNGGIGVEVRGGLYINTDGTIGIGVDGVIINTDGSIGLGF